MIFSSAACGAPSALPLTADGLQCRLDPAHQGNA
jgi:hypothetical protein